MFIELTPEERKRIIEEIIERTIERLLTEFRDDFKMFSPTPAVRFGFQSLACLKRSAFPITETLLSAMAAPATIGLSSQPVRG